MTILSRLRLAWRAFWNLPVRDKRGRFVKKLPSVKQLVERLPK